MPREKRIRSEGKLEILRRKGNSLIAYFENMAGERAGRVFNLEPGEIVQINMVPVISDLGLPISWVGVGPVMRSCGDIGFALRLDRGEIGPNAMSPVAEFFPKEEPFRYRVIFRLTHTGLS